MFAKRKHHSTKVTPANCASLTACAIAAKACGRTKLRRYASTMRRLGAGASNGTMENSKWSLSVSAVDASNHVANRVQRAALQRVCQPRHALFCRQFAART